MSEFVRVGGKALLCESETEAIVLAIQELTDEIRLFREQLFEDCDEDYED